MSGLRRTMKVESVVVRKISSSTHLFYTAFLIRESLKSPYRSFLSHFSLELPAS